MISAYPALPVVSAGEGIDMHKKFADRFEGCLGA